MTTCSEGEIRYTFHMSVKEQVLQAIQCLPDDINFRDVTDEIALLAAIQDAERDVEDGRLISNDEMKSRISQWSAIGRVWPASMGEADLDNSPLVSGDMRGQFQPIQSNFDDLRGRLIRRKQTRLRGSIRTDLHFHLATPWQRGESIVALSLDGLDIAAEFGFDDGQLVGQQRHFQRQNE